MNSIQKYPHIIESYAYILNILLLIRAKALGSAVRSKELDFVVSLLPMNLLISLGICSMRKLSK